MRAGRARGVRQPDKYFGYAERVANAMGGEGSVYLCRRSHEADIGLMRRDLVDANQLKQRDSNG